MVCFQWNILNNLLILLTMIIKDLGLIDFREAYALQERVAAGVATGAEEETLLLLEHPPVYTLGSGGSEGNILDPSIAAVRINRGGDVTFHGPGQLVAYPIINLARRGRDLHLYLRFLEELIIAIAADFGVTGHRLSGKTGVWTGSQPAPAKLASIGVGVRRWVTMHGFALNVTTDLSQFSRINPCGFIACPVTSLLTECSKEVSVREIKERVAQRFEIFLDDLLPLDSGGII
jgi:lipoyl(octanoyl) transferase